MPTHSSKSNVRGGWPNRIVSIVGTGRWLLLHGWHHRHRHTVFFKKSTLNCIFNLETAKRSPEKAINLPTWHFKGCSWSWDQPNWPITAWALGIFLQSELRKQIFSQNGHQSNVLRNFFHACYSSYVLGHMLVLFMWQDCCCDCLVSSSRNFVQFLFQKMPIQLHFFPSKIRV